MIQQNSERFGIAALILVTAAVLIRTAWVCDDSYISFRVVDNFVNGYGLVWNVGERVQAFTNPLWVLVISLFDLLTGEVYYTSIFLSIVLTLVTLWIISFHIADNWIMSVMGLLILLLSKAFVDYSTSGLENPLTHLLLAVFFLLYFRREHTSRTLMLLTFVAALCMTNRMDTALLVLPALAYVIWHIPWRRTFRPLLIGFTPFIVWDLFSIVYYGFPFPNTYYAKLHAGIPAGQMAEQGFLYFLDSLNRDPLTLLVIIAVLLTVVLGKKRNHISVAVGIVLYLIYIARIGGDFMSGRFFAAPLLIATILFVRWPYSINSWKSAFPVAVIILLGFATATPTVVSADNYGTHNENRINHQGIADERGWYYQSTGLLRDSRGNEMPAHPWAQRGSALRKSDKKVMNEAAIGFLGYYAGPEVHIVDLHGLSDPLLARLPVNAKHSWRPGHLARNCPAGYLGTIETGENQIVDSVVAAFYQSLKLVTCGDIWSLNRFREIARLNLTDDGDLLSYVIQSKLIVKMYDEFCDPRPQGAYWNLPLHAVIGAPGLQINWDDVVHPSRLELSVDHNDDYLITLMRGDTSVAELDVKRCLLETGGLRVDTVQISPEAAAAGFDHLIITPVSGDDCYSVGHVRILPED